VNEVYLGVIAVAVAAMAVIQVAAIVVAMRTARRVGEAVARLENDVRPIVTNLKSMSVDAARTASIASAQAQRAEQLIGDVTARVNDTVAAVEATVMAPAREAYAVMQGLLGALAAFRHAPSRPVHHRDATSEEEDSLFIG
jgi:dihydroxyacetone kinase-like predicted kinase